jgi:hypothetical protein
MLKRKCVTAGSDTAEVRRHVRAYTASMARVRTATRPTGREGSTKEDCSDGAASAAYSLPPGGVI